MFTFNTISIIFIVFYVLVFALFSWLAYRFVKAHEKIADNTKNIAGYLNRKEQSE